MQNTYAYATRTDAKGIGVLKILRPGPWLVVVAHELPATDREGIDLLSYHATLTFAVREP